MRTFLRILLVAVLLVGTSGCALRYYDVTLNNGTVIGAKGKPKLVNGYYVFNDLRGEQKEISQFRIRSVAPHSEKRSPFNNYGAQ